MWALLTWLWIRVKAWLSSGRRPRQIGRRRLSLQTNGWTQAKPAWVTREIIHLKALMPGAGCRRIADTFNRRHARHRVIKRRMTVGKSFVAETMRKHRYEIDIQRRRIKHRVPPALPRNLVWAMDLTGKQGVPGYIHSIFGLLDHGSRGLLDLAASPDKRSWTLLGHLFLMIGKYGKPRAAHGQRSVFHQPGVSLRAVAGRHSSAAQRSRLSMAERTDRKIVRHVEAQTRSMGSGKFRSLEQFAGGVQVLLQPRATASALARLDAYGSVVAGRSVCQADQARFLVRGVGWIVAGLLFAKVKWRTAGNAEPADR